MNLLQKGLKYNLQHKPKYWINNLDLEAETAIQHIPKYNQDIVRHQLAKKLDSLYKHHNNNKLAHKSLIQEKTVISQIKSLLDQHKATITKADKGNSLIIIYEADYCSKTLEFIDRSQFSLLQHDPTNTFQKDLKHTINKCIKLIPNDQKWKYCNMNPTAPKLRSLIKVHKINNLMRPIVNWENAPAYKISRYINKKLNTLAPLPYAYNIRNTSHLIKDLNNFTHNKDISMISFDIQNMYTNIPNEEVLNIIKNSLIHNNVNPYTITEIIDISKSILNQNYFLFNNQYYIQEQGLAMGAPTSSTFSE